MEKQAVDVAKEVAPARERIAVARKALDLLVEAAALASLPLRDHQRVHAGAAAIAALLDEAATAPVRPSRRRRSDP